MKFRFRLEKMLHFLRLKETSKKLEVSLTNQRISFLQKRKGQLEENLRTLLSDPTMALSPEWAFYRNQKIGLDSKEIDRMNELAREEKLVLAQKLKELGQILMKAKALESLKEKRYADFRVEENRRQQGAQDEAFRLSKGAKG